MSIGYWIVKGDRTSCGGVVLNGNPHKRIGQSNFVATVGSPVSCGKHPGTYSVMGGYQGDIIEGQFAASTLYSRSSCPCKAFFEPSITWMSHGLYQDDATPPRSSSLAGSSSARKKAPPEPLPLPALIYQTKRRMDDYRADDMRYGDLTTEMIRNRFHINIDNVSMKVNPYTLMLKDPDDPLVLPSPYVHPDFQPKPMPMVSHAESAALMFDEFRELAKMFSFQGEYKHIITDMITHMQKNNGKPYSNPLLDQALKEQILNDDSEESTLLRIKRILNKSIDYGYGFIPLEHKEQFQTLINSNTILPKFDRIIDRTNGLVITVHDIWSTHITLESLEVQGNNYKAKVHYRIQDHFGLNNDDVLNPLYRQFRIFRLWFVLQRWVEFGYRPFITEMNATVEITGRRSE